MNPVGHNPNCGNRDCYEYYNNNTQGDHTADQCPDVNCVSHSNTQAESNTLFAMFAKQLGYTSVNQLFGFDNANQSNENIENNNIDNDLVSDDLNGGAASYQSETHEEI